MPITRRDVIRTGIVAAAASVADKAMAVAATAPSTKPATTQSFRPRLGVIGNGGLARYFGTNFLGKYADIVALCDVDAKHLAAYNTDFAGGKAFCSGDYRKVLERSDVEICYIATPDHWHTKIAIDAMRAGKDIYCEKPLTLTIGEGRLFERVARETNRIVQVGTQQRSDERFVTAVALAHGGRLGKIRQVSVVLGKTPATGANFPIIDPPPELDWNMWLGQAPKVPYVKERCHNNFRWWYEYSGGLMTDWGAHHVDIAQWAVAPDLPGPSIIEPVSVELPVPFERGYPLVHNSFNTPMKYVVRCTFGNGVEMIICDQMDGFPADNGVLISGDGGYCFVNRAKITGPAYDALKDDPLPAGMVPKFALPPDKAHEGHFANFIECVRDRTTPRSDVFSHHRNLTTCHLANIAMRLGRTLHWDASAQQITNDAEADAFQSRAQRRGFEVM